MPGTFARPDEEATISTALRFFGRHLDPQFFDWPSLFMYTVAATFVGYFNVGRLRGWFPHESTFLAAASSNPVPLHLLARAVSVAAGTATVGIVHRIGERMGDRHTGNAAAFFLAVAALHVRDSHFGVPDIMASCLATASFLWTVRFVASGAWRDAAGSAVFAGLAASTKYNVGIIVAPALLAILTSRQHSQLSTSRRITFFGLYCGMAALAFCLGTPYAAIESPRFLRALESVAAHLRQGHVVHSGPAWQIQLSSSLWHGLGWPLLFAGVAGMLLLCWRDRRLGLVFVSFPLLYLAAIGSAQTAFARYTLPLLPFLCLSAAYFVNDLAIRAAELLRRSALRGAILCVIAALAAWPSAMSAVQTDRILMQTDTRVLAATLIHHVMPCGATVYQSGNVYGHVQMRVVASAHANAFTPVRFDETSGLFQSGEYAASDLPTLIVVQHSPLAYSKTSEAIRHVLATHYRLEAEVHGVDTSDGHLVYDYDDAFFVPLAGLTAVSNPGPNIRIYVRRDAAPSRC